MTDETAPAPATASGGRTGLNRRKTVIQGVIGLVFLVFVFAFLLPKLGNYGDAWDSIKTMGLVSVAGLAVAMVVYLLVYPLPFVAAAPGLRYRDAFVVGETSFMLSNAVPAGAAVSVGMQYAMLGSFGLPAARAAAVVAVNSVWSVFITLGVPILGLAALAASGRANSTNVITALLGLLVLAVAIVLFALILAKETVARRVGALADRLAGRLISRFRHGRSLDLTGAILNFRVGILDTVKRRWAAITVTNLLVSLSQFAILFLALRAVEGDAPSSVTFLETFGAWAIAQIGIMIPITPGGLGTVDATLAALLTSFGASPADALAATIVWRAVSFVPLALTGVATLITWQVRRGHAALASDRAPGVAPGSGEI